MPNKPTNQLLLIFALLTLGTVVLGLEVSDRTSVPVLEPHIEIFQDKGARFEFSPELRVQDFDRIAGSSSLGFSADAWWVRVQLSNPQPEPVKLFLRQDYPLIDYLDVWTSAQSTNWNHTATGDRRVFDTRPVEHREFLFPLDVPARGQMTVYLRYQSTGPINITLNLHSPEAMIRTVSMSQLAYGAYFGGFVVLVCYNLFLFMVVRDRAFLFYLLYASSYGLYMAVHNGVAFQIFWPQAPDLGNQMLLLLLTATLIGGLEFSRRFLSTPETLPKLDIAARVLEWLSAAGLVASFFLSYGVLIQPISVLTLAVTVVILIMGTASLLQGYRPARYFMIAWTVLLLGVIVYMLKSFGFLPHNVITHNAFQIGSLLEMILLSLALASRVNELQVLSLTDPLTNLANRRAFDDRINTELRQAQKSRKPLSLMIMDIDWFKKFNDEFGHEEGDRVLKTVGAVLHRHGSGRRLSSRFGGEEFALILPATGRNDAIALAEEIRDEVSSQANFARRVTLSVGVATTAGHTDSQSLFVAADRAMYEAKNTGRDRVVAVDQIVARNLDDT